MNTNTPPPEETNPTSEPAPAGWIAPELQKLPVGETAELKKLIDTEGLELS